MTTVNCPSLYLRVYSLNKVLLEKVAYLHLCYSLQLTIKPSAAHDFRILEDHASFSRELGKFRMLVGCCKCLLDIAPFEPTMKCHSKNYWPFALIQEVNRPAFPL